MSTFGVIRDITRKSLQDDRVPCMIKNIHEKLKDILSRQIKMSGMSRPSQFIDRVVHFKGIFVNSVFSS